MSNIHRKLTICATALGAGLLLSSAGVRAETIEFNASNWQPESTALVQNGYKEWAAHLEEISGGALKAKVFNGSVLLPPAAHLSGVRDGIAQVGFHAGTYTPADIPLDNILAQLAFNYSDNFVATLAVTDINMNDAELQAQWDRHNIVFGGGFATIPYRLFCTTKVTSLADLEGKKLRMPGSVHSDWAKSVGAVPVNVPSSEMYSGLEKGQLDCASNTIEQLKTSSLWDIAKHTTMVELGIYYAGYEWGINKDFWKGLSDEQRRMMFDAFARAMARTMMGYVKAGEAVLAEVASKGVTVHEPEDDLKQSITDFKANANAAAIKVGTEKFKVDNAADLVDRFEATIAKWETLLAGIDRTDEAAVVALVKSEIYDKIDVSTYGQ